jgi:hypothetical protein
VSSKKNKKAAIVDQVDKDNPIGSGSRNNGILLSEFAGIVKRMLLKDYQVQTITDDV